MNTKKCPEFAIREESREKTIKLTSWDQLGADLPEPEFEVVHCVYMVGGYFDRDAPLGCYASRAEADAHVEWQRSLYA